MNEDRFERLDKLHARASELFGMAIAKHGGSACGDRCPACCREPVHASRLEAERIVATLDDAQKEALKVKLAIWLKAFYASGQNAHERPLVFSYIPAVPACPLLNGTRCGVYEHRPIECRAHFALKHRSYCEDLEKRKEQKHASFSVALMSGVCMEHMNIETEFIADHLCIHLAEILIGPQQETAARCMYVVEKEAAA